ncbi:S1 RNA-binding domain-containing protein [Ruminococcus sp. zg-924]|uniref:S1 RNA-binding domain-containing protein n=1 Tax=Ruminococcus sp. zg-924 TaxID=2678505 RepID=UPI00210B74EC|nr:S1 RNA-binding domain-containing protein [Ruminococcus sp. zg-924]MCQ4022815.1 S1 RNA-binding domain-containing protein [Ruminococcus sp. zg-924]
MDYQKQELSNAIIKIIEIRGIDILKNPNVFCSLLDDIVPKLQRERKIIRRIILGNSGLCNELISLYYCSESDLSMNISKFVYNIKSEYGVSDEWINFFISVFADAFGWCLDNTNGIQLFENEITNNDPWLAFKQKYQIGTIVDATVIGLTRFGVVVEIIHGVDGLIHISKLSKKDKNEISDEYSIGDIIKAKIDSIDFEKKRVSLKELI